MARAAATGLGMLVEQAAVAFELFRGACGPQTAPVLSALRERMQGGGARRRRATRTAGAARRRDVKPLWRSAARLVLLALLAALAPAAVLRGAGSR